VSVNNHQDRPPEENGPPDEVGGGAPRTTRATPTNPINYTSTLDSADTDILGQHRRRRAASWRLLVQESGRSDPWHYQAPTAGYEDAARHLLTNGLTPAPNVPALQAMWTASAESRAVAQLIVKRWELVA
jgi:hypothetical protein